MVIFAALLLTALVISVVAYPFISNSDEKPVISRSQKTSNLNRKTEAKDNIETQVLARRKTRGSFCPQCGAPDQKNNKFCSQCGNDLLH